jgi:tRNA pseudouridine65 synthase
MNAELKSAPLILEVLFEDDHYIAINKPAGVLVHRTSIAKEERELVALQLLREQIGCRVYPLHRIDRPTSGILLFSKNPEAAALLQPLFPTQEVKKYYLAIVRGYMAIDHGIIDSPLRKKLVGELQDAKTEFWCLERAEIPYATTGRYPTSRYSLVKVYPHTGRMHQIRRHLARERHYIIGDNTHGDCKQNNFFRNHFDSMNLMLHAWHLRFNNPYTKVEIEIKASLPQHFIKAMEIMEWDPKSIQIDPKD